MEAQIKHNGYIVIGKIVQEWKAMPGKVAVEIEGFKYSKTNFSFHILDKKDIVKYLTK